MDSVVTFLFIAAFVIAAFLALVFFTKELYNYVRSRTIERAVKAAAVAPRTPQSRRADDGHGRAAAPRGDSTLTHDERTVGHVVGVTTPAAGEISGVSGAGESAGGSWGESGGGYESSSSGGDGGGGGGDYGGGGGGGGWS